ncbi:MAG: tetratricopeptide repeat protein [Ruminococcaceae bacterium]|nr:tetratricopeptide repeat protein [Oscillospiraceae bacterium]
MTELLYATKGNASPKNKPRVYFTCHPEDFPHCFEKICGDIFQTHDCAIYYTGDMCAELPEEDRAADLGRMNLFVVPVTYRLLSTPNRAMDADIAYAVKEHIPVLPFMMESGIDAFYAAPDKFGELQYINPYSQDRTEISYAEKLKKYLDSVLINDDTAKRIRAAFDAYIFLSYRKKDRCYANELMRIIHGKPECRDIAVWYDEYLTPGESFNENIGRMLKESRLFTLLVTPNLLEEPDGKPNYVMANEYPAAREIGMEILPAVMEETDRRRLLEKFEGLPECVDPNDDEAFQKRLLASLSRIALTANDDDPEHNFLIGLAYLDGIDVEKNRTRGLELITSAAGASVPEAMKKLLDIYSCGLDGAVDYARAVYWAEKLTAYYTETRGADHPETQTAAMELAQVYNLQGAYQKAIAIEEAVYEARRGTLGEEHPDTLVIAGNLSLTYSHAGEYAKALALQEKVYDLKCRILGEEHPEAIISLDNLALLYGACDAYEKLASAESFSQQAGKAADFGTVMRGLRKVVKGQMASENYEKAAALGEKAYALKCREYGEEHPSTVLSLGNLAVAYGRLQEYGKAVPLEEKVYAWNCRQYGEEHPSTLRALGNLSVTYSNLYRYEQASTLCKKAYLQKATVLGEEHPSTLLALSNFAWSCGLQGDYTEALALQNRAHQAQLQKLGENHADTLRSQANIRHYKTKKLLLKISMFVSIYTLFLAVMEGFYQLPVIQPLMRECEKIAGFGFAPIYIGGMISACIFLAVHAIVMVSFRLMSRDRWRMNRIAAVCMNILSVVLLLYAAAVM